jgi:hypothetical protein
MLKTLLERAKPELIAAINAQMDEYPGIAESTVNHLDSVYTVCHLHWGVWVDVKSLWMQVTGELQESPWECFDDM